MSTRNKAGLILCMLFTGTAGAATNPISPRMPFVFVANQGQADARVRYIGSGNEFKAWFEDRGVIFQQGKTAVRVSFGSSALPRITPETPTGARANYLRGSDPRGWHTDLPLFGAVRYAGLWPGVDLTYRAERSGVKAEYTVSPGADPGAILLKFDGHAEIRGDGSLKVGAASGDFIEETPVLYQLIAGKKVDVSGGFNKLADDTIGFWTADYDRTQPLVIDPVVLFSGYFGGSSEDDITAVGIDPLNNVVVAGWTASTDLPATGGAQPRNRGGVDAFVASFLPNGGGMNYCTYLGGSGDDRAFGLAIDSAQNVYLTGWTSSTNFPVVNAFQSHLKGTRDAFVAKLNATGSALVYSTYLGGSAVDVGYAIGLDAINSAVIVGDSTSSDLPVSSTAYQKKLAGSQDAFVAKISPGGNTLTFLTYLGGSGIDHGSSLNVGPGGGYFIAGYTWSSNFPTVVPYQSKSGGGQDGFFAKMSADGSSLVFSSYLGGYGGSVGAPEEINAIYRDPLGNTVVAGTTSSPNFPVTPGALQTAFGGQTDGFIARFSTSWKLMNSTFLGGSLSDGINAMAHDFHGVPYVTGFTDSPDFPVQSPLQGTNAGGMDAFVVKMNSTFSSEAFGTYLGGSGSDTGNAIAVDFETSVVIAGQTGSGDFPVSGSLQNSGAEVLSSFIAKIAPSFMTGLSYGFQGQELVYTDPWHVAGDLHTTVFGNSTDLPLVADWDGTGTKRIGIFRNGTWILDIDGSGVIDSNSKTVVFGQAGDVPVVGDWLGTGHIALGLFRQGTFILDLSGHLSGVPTGQSDATFPFGQGGDIPIVADWSGSGTTKVGIFRNGLWLVDYAGARVFNGQSRSYIYGQAGDLPVVGNWDSSGSPPKIGIYRAGLWVLDYDGDNAWTVPYVNEMVLGFGSQGFTPLVY
jgi:hypothetical protein